MEHPPKKAPDPEVVGPSEAVHTPDVAKTDLGSMEEAEIRKVVKGSRCTFSYTAEGKPVFAASADDEGASGVVKIHGKLISIRSSNIQNFNSLKRGGAFQAGGLIVEVRDVKSGGEETLDKQGAEANLHFELKEEQHTVDYRGWYRCRPTEAEPTDS